MTMRAAVLGCLLGLMPVSGQAQTLVLGRVTDASRQGIAGMSVQLIVDGVAGGNAVTDEEGAFQLMYSPDAREASLRFAMRRLGVRGRSLLLNREAGRQTASFPEMRVELEFHEGQGAPPPETAPPPVPPAESPFPTYSIVRRESGRRYLASGEVEEAGFGLYSYLLFKRRATPGEPAYALHVSTVQALLGQVVPIEGLLPYRDQSELNVTYVPLTDGLPVDDAPEKILERYDYARARILAGAIADASGDGPYFVSVPAPLGQGRTVPSRVLVQDLTGVPARLASLWVRKFVDQVAEPRAWDEVGLSQLVLLLRTRIAQEADAFPEYRNALVSLIVLR